MLAERDQPLPDDIAAGVNPPTLHLPVGDGPVETLELRKGWNKPAPDEYALPTETWREVVARRTRYEEVRGKLAAGQVRDMCDLITLNLDIRQFAQDVIENCEGPELLRAFWHAIEKVTILDPTCGSGAFLFAALNILEPLYEACLDRMEAFGEDIDHSGDGHHPEKFSDFRTIMDRVDAHPNRRYFIFKSIILNNLFGVDIMEEAVEICKLRLFLKLAAQVQPDAKHANLGIEPLPDIDFNIKAGNTLVGFATYDDVKKVIFGGAQGKMDVFNEMQAIAVKAADLQEAFDAFRKGQVEGEGSVPIESKQELLRRLTGLQDGLNRYLAAEYGVESTKTEAYAKWLRSHQPFHWFVEFYGIMNSGGFNVVIGNPPYVEHAEVAKTYTVLDPDMKVLGNLHAMVARRTLTLLASDGGMSMIVPVSLPSTDRFKALREDLSRTGEIWVSHYDFRPSKLFDGAEQRLTIFVLRPRRAGAIHSTRYNRWYADQRNCLFPSLAYTTWNGVSALRDVWPKLAGEQSTTVLKKIRAQEREVVSVLGSGSPARLFYKNTGILYYTTFTHEAPICFINGKRTPSSRETVLGFSNPQARHALHCLLNSSVFFASYQLHSNCRDLNPSDIHTFRFPASILEDRALHLLSDELHENQQANSQFRIRNQRLTGEVRLQSFSPALSKPVLDRIDLALARHYGFTEEELDFIINYDIKYRMGRNAESDEE